MMDILLDKMYRIVYILILVVTDGGRFMKTKLRRIRFDRGELSQQQVADMVGVSRQTIVAIERGDYSPSVKLALLIAEKLETAVEELFILEEKDYD